MLQLNQTGYMHNRLRMVTASFLVKDLGIDWRRGERYFAEQLNDFDFSANNGGWQWAASTGCDAQPYFRIFNPVTQSEKFDPKGALSSATFRNCRSCRRSGFTPRGWLGWIASRTSG
jgi:deoxyribodipyrimidine photo-lyase